MNGRNSFVSNRQSFQHLPANSNDGPSSGGLSMYQNLKRSSRHFGSNCVNDLEPAPKPQTNLGNFTSKAINLSSKLLTKSASYLSSKDLDLLANPINRAAQIVNPVSSSSKPTPASSVYQSEYRIDRSHQRSVESWKQWDDDSSNWNMKVGGQPVNVRSTSIESSDSSSIQPRSINQTPSFNSSTTSSGPSYLSYLYPQNWQKRNKESNYSEDHLVCFPGFVALASPSHFRAGDIEVFVSIHAFRAKSTLDNPNRSQRLLYSMICKMTGLPPLPSNLSPMPAESNVQRGSLLEDDLLGLDEDHSDKLDKLEPLLASSKHSNLKSGLPVRPESYSRTSERPIENIDTRFVSESIKITQTLPTPINANRIGFSNHSRSSSVNSKSSHSLSEPEGLSSLSGNILDGTASRLNESFHMQHEDLHHLHLQLKERLHSFFSQKCENTQIRLKLYGICSPTKQNRFKNSLFKSRTEEPDLLTPDLNPDEFIINDGRPLLTRIVTTKPGGVWADKILLPWQTIETHLRVSHLKRRSQFIDQLQNSSFAQSPDIGVVRLKIEAELVQDEHHPNDTFLPCRGSSSNPDQSKKESIRKLSVGKSSLAIELDVIPALAESIHVISDIDDTIKHTDVLGGLKYVLKNVFLADFEQVAIPGMAEWYQSLQRLGCWIHYISNSPLELWYCIEGFLASAGFPRGSVSLKEYARDATSILSGILESAGARKRARVESIVRRFPNAKFICIGDSGEQDMEMYVSLAQAYPGWIISIYIRDVTTPAISAKGVSIDQLDLSSCDLLLDADGQAKRPSRINADVVSSSRSSSPSGLLEVTPRPANKLGTHPPRSKSLDVTHPSKPPTSSKKTSFPKPLAPPKPMHLVSKRIQPGTATNSHNPVKIEGDYFERTDEQPLAETSKSSTFSSANLIPRTISQFPNNAAVTNVEAEQPLNSPRTSVSSLSRANVHRRTTTCEDLKTQALLDAFRNRVRKAELDLKRIHRHSEYTIAYRQGINDYSTKEDGGSCNHLDPYDPLPNHSNTFFDHNSNGVRSATKLKLFRTGLDDCREDSIREVEFFFETMSLKSPTFAVTHNQ